MTKEYIERGALLAEAEYDANFRLVIPAEKVRKLPAADVVEVKHGRWRQCSRNWNFWRSCNLCGKNVVEEYRYCPNCGARMRGGNDGE